jgi:hypothetical protein
VLREFFDEKLGQSLAACGKQADLIAGNNVDAHVPDINDFTRGLKALLKPTGCITLEFLHLLQLISQTQFDTVYHEHFSYLSLYAVECIFEKAGLRVWYLESLPTHGGSLRVYGCHSEDQRATDASVAQVREQENIGGLCDLNTYRAFQARADKVKDGLLAFLIEAERDGKTVAAYGAAAKGNTLLNYAGVKSDLLPFVCDAAVAKQNNFMPGSHIPIFPPEVLAQRRPDYVVILPWNIAAEVKQQTAALAQLGTRFVTAVQQLETT